METIILRMNVADWIIFFLAIGAHVPLILGVIKQKWDKSQTFLTWVLYFLLDLVTMLSSQKIDGNYVILFGFSVGSFVMWSILLYQGRIGWTWLETVTLILVISCVGAWYVSGPYLALVFGIASEAIVGINLIIKTYRNPVIEYNLVGYIIFLIVSFFAFFTAEDFNIKQVGYPICEGVLSFITLIPLLRKL
jgi:hypothetical protein